MYAHDLQCAHAFLAGEHQVNNAIFFLSGTSDSQQTLLLHLNLVNGLPDQSWRSSLEKGTACRPTAPRAAFPGHQRQSYRLLQLIASLGPPSPSGAGYRNS